MKRYPCDRVTEAFVDDAPARFVSSELVAAAPADIWAALADGSAWPRWTKVIKSAEWSSPRPFGVGTTRTVTMVGGLVGYEEFIGWEPHRRMVFRFNEASTRGVRAFAERYVLEAVSPGETRLTWTMAMSPNGVSRVIVPLARRPMRRGFASMLRRFKTLVESEYLGAGAVEN